LGFSFDEESTRANLISGTEWKPHSSVQSSRHFWPPPPRSLSIFFRILEQSLNQPNNVWRNTPICQTMHVCVPCNLMAPKMTLFKDLTRNFDIFQTKRSTTFKNRKFWMELFFPLLIRYNVLCLIYILRKRDEVEILIPSNSTQKKITLPIKQHSTEWQFFFVFLLIFSKQF